MGVLPLKLGAVPCGQTRGEEAVAGQEWPPGGVATQQDRTLEAQRVGSWAAPTLPFPVLLWHLSGLLPRPSPSGQPAREPRPPSPGAAALLVQGAGDTPSLFQAVTPDD